MHYKWSFSIAMLNYQRVTRGSPMRKYILVGGFKHEFYCPFHIWDGIILPIDELIFFRGVETTNHLLLMNSYNGYIYNHIYNSLNWFDIFLLFLVWKISWIAEFDPSPIPSSGDCHGLGWWFQAIPIHEKNMAIWGCLASSFGQTWIRCKLAMIVSVPRNIPMNIPIHIPSTVCIWSLNHHFWWLNHTFPPSFMLKISIFQHVWCLNHHFPPSWLNPSCLFGEKTIFGYTKTSHRSKIRWPCWSMAPIPSRRATWV